MDKPDFKDELKKSIEWLVNSTKIFILKKELMYLTELHKVDSLEPGAQADLKVDTKQLLEKSFRDLQYNLEGVIEDCILDLESDFENAIIDTQHVYNTHIETPEDAWGVDEIEPE